MLLKTIFTTVLAGSFALAMPTATDISYLDEATQALQTSVLYVSPSVSDLSQEQQANLSSQIGSDSIAIVVLPTGAQSEIDSIPTFISQLASRTHYETILVSIGGDFEAGSSTLNSGQASQLANAAEGGNLGDGLNEFVSEVQSNQPTTSSATDPLGGIGVILVSGVVGAVILFGAIVMITRARKPKHTKEISNVKVLEKTSKKRYEATPEVIRQLLEDVEAKARELNDSEVTRKVLETTKHVLELFARAPKTEIQQVTGQYEVKLGVMLRVLTKFQDIEANPLYYEATEKQAEAWLRDGRVSVDQYQAGVFLNIREITKGGLTDYKITTRIMNATAQSDEASLIQPDPIAIEKKEKR